MVVLDISHLESICYGIFAFEINYMADVRLNAVGDWDAVEDSPPPHEPMPWLEEPRSRSPLSARRFMKKFHSYAFRERLKPLNRLSVVEESALDCTLR
jgi:hypothetical protein